MTRLARAIAHNGLVYIVAVFVIGVATGVVWHSILG